MAGRIEVITGPMFSGKTTELLRRLERYTLAGKRFCAFKPETDTRQQKTSISTIRGEIDLCPMPVSKLTYIPQHVEVIVLDEAQFFNEEVVSFCQEAKDQGKVVLVSGLDMDHNRKPFGFMGDLMCIADSVTKLTAVCPCGKDAVYTKKIDGDKAQLIEIGDQCYLPYCAECYNAESVINTKLEGDGNI